MMIGKLLLITYDSSLVRYVRMRVSQLILFEFVFERKRSSLNFSGGIGDG
jgi:hypothetical protein